MSLKVFLSLSFHPQFSYSFLKIKKTSEWGKKKKKKSDTKLRIISRAYNSPTSDVLHLEIWIKTLFVPHNLTPCRNCMRWTVIYEVFIIKQSLILEPWIERTGKSFILCSRWKVFLNSTTPPNLRWYRL